MTAHRWPTIKRSVIFIHCYNSNTLLRTIPRRDHPDDYGELSAELSLGDIAHFAGADIALHCSQSIDWKNIDFRRTIIGIVVGWIRRAYPGMDDGAITEDIALLDLWSKGNATPELTRRRDTLLKEVVEMPPEPPYTSDETAIMQIWMLMQTAAGGKTEADLWTNYGAASVAIVGSQLVTDAQSDPEEMARQIQDIVEQFPRT